MRISIIGTGKSGFAAAKLALKKEHEVFVSDAGHIDKYKEEADFYDKHNIKYEFGKHSDKILDCDLIVTSPGVPPTFRYFQEARTKKIPVISELEFAYSYLEDYKAIIAVTGTNGKTTVVNLMQHILISSGQASLLCGNVGTPLSDCIGSEEGCYIIIEASSYQLDSIQTFRPDIAIITNITPDHLSYHGNFVEYFRAKWKITSNQKQSDLLILNQDDPLYSERSGKTDFDISGELPEKSTQAQIKYFSVIEKSNGAFIEDNIVWITQQHKDKEEFMPTSQFAMPGMHNVYNTLSAILACRYLEIPDEDIRDSIAAFKGVEHRIEHIAAIDGANWYNDSKATNVNAAWYALSSFDKPIIWLAGGEGDGNDYRPLNELVKNNVKNIISYGKESYAIHSIFSSLVACDRVESLQDAVQLANALAEEGDIILLSPACKSFDQFMNFEERGKEFKKMVMDLV